MTFNPTMVRLLRRCTYQARVNENARGGVKTMNKGGEKPPPKPQVLRIARPTPTLLAVL
jgi:hypothetical protein